MISSSLKKLFVMPLPYPYDDKHTSYILRKHFPQEFPGKCLRTMINLDYTDHNSLYIWVQAFIPLVNNYDGNILVKTIS